MVNGLRNSQNRKEKRSSEYSYNHVDRVRVGRNSAYNRDSPNRGSGWRQKSISHSDLVASKTSSNNFTHLRSSRSLDWNNNTDFHEFLSQIEPEKDYDDYYNESYENKQKAEYYNQYDVGNESCSLRRTRSLAVIREETFNDLQISNGNGRRSQLIPRAKLVNRSFFRRRHHQKQRLEEDSTGSGVETQTSETRESDDYYSNLKRLDSVKIVPPAWQNDKSDLESLNSDYFKNSSHQTQQEEHKHRQYQQKRDKIPHSGNRYQALAIEVHQDNSQSSAFPETTPSTSDQSDTSSDQLEEEENNKETVCEEQQHQEFEEVHLEDIIQIGINEAPTPSGTLTLKNHSDVPNSFIAYNSVYLSSEESSEGTVIEEAFNEELNGVVSALNSECASLLQISIEDDCDRGTGKEESLKEEPEIIYTEVKKNNSSVSSTNPPSSKPKILSVERKLKTLSDYAKTTKRGVLEHLTYISTSQVLKANEVAIIDSFQTNLTENQYYSLPDINIGRSLKVSERIDAKLRSTYNLRHSEHIESSLTSDQTAIFDSINKFGRAHKRARQREYGEVDSLIKAKVSNVAGVDEIKLDVLEQPREAPTLEVKAECKEKQAGDEDSLGESESHSTEEQETPIVLAPLEPTSIEAQPSREKTKTPELKRKHDLSNFHVNQTANNFPGQFRIIVTDVQNNVIEEDSIESTPGTEEPFGQDISQQSKVSNGKSKECPTQAVFAAVEIKESATTAVQKITKPTRKILKSISDENLARSTISRTHIKTCLKTTSIYKARPVTVCANEVKSTGTKMSRPQILHVIDSKRGFNSGKQEDTKGTTDDKAEKEFLEKVDSVRCYWSKLIQNGKIPGDESQESEERNFVTNLEADISEKTNKCPPVGIAESPNDLHSFTPTVEIFELDGQKQATIVKAHDADNPEFDHVRYKVMKSNLFRNNILTRSKKEAQFDGLMQYLQDYSFQELLTNNNVVIIEPVRTKIEKPSLGELKPHTVNCKITGGSGTDSKSNTKRHFFYHPVRVNRELLEDELPTPDTVRNVRKLFEENIRHKKPQSKLQKPVDNSTSAGHKRRSLRYLTIDTSYGGLRKWDSASLSSGISSGDLSSPCECNDAEAQDSERVPVQPQPGPEGEMFSSEENLCDDELCESYYVSEDVLEKIRECGSTVTYYGGRVVDNKSPELSPMAKNIIQEIKGKGSKCNACQPNSCPQHNELEKKLSCKGLGVKFKLVKSNSCSSRLELVGTEKLNEAGFPEETLLERQHRGSSPPIEAEESVRELVSRLESGAASKAPVPRIIESQCIEKTHKNGAASSADAVTINNHLIGEAVELVDIIKQVTVNNHISFCPSAANSKSLPAAGSDVEHLDEAHASSGQKVQQKGNNKVCRNKNVDLALGMTKGHSEKVKSASKDRENEFRRPIVPPSSDVAINKSESLREGTGAAQAAPSSEQRKPAAPLNSTMTMKCDISAKTGDTRKGSGDPCDGVHKAIQNANKIENNKFQLEVSGGKVTTRFQLDHPDKQQSASPKEKDSPRENTKSHSNTNEEKKTSSLRSSKVEVTTVDKSFVKHYVANDRKLMERRKYDDIEFEEFEIYDPAAAAAATSEAKNNPAGTNGTSEECYDSLDDKV